MSQKANFHLFSGEPQATSSKSSPGDQLAVLVSKCTRHDGVKNKLLTRIGLSPARGLRTRENMGRLGENSIGEVRFHCTLNKSFCFCLLMPPPLLFSGSCVSPREEQIRGSLKYNWKEGRSKAKGSELVQIVCPAIHTS